MKSADPFSSGHARGMHRRPRFSLGSAALALLLILLFVIALKWRSSFSGSLWSAMMPIEHGYAALGAALDVPFAAFASREQLLRDNADLRAQLAQANIQVADREVLYQENNALKGELGRSDGQDRVLASVIAAPPALPYDTVMIDAGENLNVSAGDLVSAGGGVLIGRITDVYGTTARAALFSSAGETTQGLLRDSIPISVVGDGEGAMSAQVPAGTEVALGDTISFPSMVPNVTETVASIGDAASDSFKMLYLHLPANISGLHFVEIWRMHTTLQQ